MRTTLYFAFVLAGYGLPAYAFFESDSLILGIIAICLGIKWMVAYKVQWSWYNPIGLVLGVVSNVYSICFFSHPSLMVISTTLTLAAWDLARYEQRLQLASSEDSLLLLSQRHLFRLLVFILAAILLGLGALQLRMKIDFWAAIVFIAITFIGLMHLVKTLLRVGRKL